MCFAYTGPEITGALAPGIRSVGRAFTSILEQRVYTSVPSEWVDIFRILQGAEIAQQHGAWIDRYNPTFGSGVRERFAWIRTIDPKEVASAKLAREHLVRHIDELLHDDAILALPTAPGIAPRLETSPVELETFRARCFALLSIAGLAGLPQVTLPLGTLDGCPLGLSLVAPRGRDRGLLDWIASHFD